MLVELNMLVPWETFVPILEQIHDKPRKSKAGRKATNALVLFKMLILKTLYNLSDEELEYQVNDHLSFMQFLGLDLDDKVPDGTTVWLFREQLQTLELIEALFEQFEQYLQQAGYAAKGGQIVDATLVPVPKQRNNVLGGLLDAGNPDDELWADSAYRSEATERALERMGFDSHINERTYRNHALTEEQKAANRERSKTRAKVEHVFGSWVNEMGGKLVRTLGLKRAQTNLGLKNLSYNLKRFVFWQRQRETPAPVTG